VSSFDSINNGLIKGDKDVVHAEINETLKEGIEAQDILTKGLIKGMIIVGKRFSSGEAFLAELLMATSSIHEGLDILKPLLTVFGQ